MTSVEVNNRLKTIKRTILSLLIEKSFVTLMITFFKKQFILRNEKNVSHIRLNYPIREKSIIFTDLSLKQILFSNSRFIQSFHKLSHRIRRLLTFLLQSNSILILIFCKAIQYFRQYFKLL